MPTFELFVSDLWRPFIGVTVGLLLGWWFKASRNNSRLPFLASNAFPELSLLGKADQERLLREASYLAFRDWRCWIPVVTIGLSIGVGFASGHALSNAAMIPDSSWAQSGVCGVIGGIGGMLAIKITTHFVRPYVRARLESAGRVASYMRVEPGR